LVISLVDNAEVTTRLVGHVFRLFAGVLMRRLRSLPCVKIHDRFATREQRHRKTGAERAERQASKERQEMIDSEMLASVPISVRSV
jgi:hypothetical protein